MGELNWLVIEKCQASKFEPKYKRVIAAFEWAILAEDFINTVIPEETRSNFYIEHR